MTQFKEKLLKRTYSFLWRAGMMLAAIVVNTLIESLAGFNLNPEVVLVLGLLLGELSKYLNNEISRPELAL